MPDLANVIADAAAPAILSTAVVKSVNSDGTVDISMAGGAALSAQVLSSYSPSPGEPVVVARVGESLLVVLGSLRAANPSSVTFSSVTALKWNVLPALSSTANPLDIAAVSAGAWRSSDGWGGRTAPSQGAALSQDGYFYGAFFYGSGAFNDLLDKNITGLSLTLTRTSSGGSTGTVPVYAALHSSITRPSGAPGFVTSPILIGRLAPGGSGTFVLPSDWGNRLAQGTARGVGLLRLTTDDYANFASPASDPTSGKLTFSWT